MDISTIKLGNIKEVLTCIRNQDGLTKKEIASLTGLSFSTVSTVCNALRDRDILYEKKRRITLLDAFPIRSLCGTTTFLRSA